MLLPHKFIAALTLLLLINVDSLDGAGVCSKPIRPAAAAAGVRVDRPVAPEVQQFREGRKSKQQLALERNTRTLVEKERPRNDLGANRRKQENPLIL